MERLNKLSECVKIASNAGYITNKESIELQTYINEVKRLIDNNLVDIYYKEWVDNMNGSTFDHLPFKEAYSAGFNKIINIICDK